MRNASRLFSPFVVPGFRYKVADGRNTKACGFLYSESTRADTKCRQQQQQGALRGVGSPGLLGQRGGGGGGAGGGGGGGAAGGGAAAAATAVAAKAECLTLRRFTGIAGPEGSGGGGAAAAASGAECLERRCFTRILDQREEEEEQQEQNALREDASPGFLGQRGGGKGGWSRSEVGGGGAASGAAKHLKRQKHCSSSNRMPCVQTLHQAGWARGRRRKRGSSNSSSRAP